MTAYHHSQCQSLYINCVKEDFVQYNKVEICGINTSKLKVLTEAEKTDLLKKAHAGDKKAREKLINSNLRLVLSVVQRFSNRGENMDDLFQVGVIGITACNI